MQKKDLKIVVAGGLFLGGTGILQGLARGTDWFGTWYIQVIYPLIVASIGRFFGLFPFSVVEFGLYFLAAGSLFYIFLHIRKPLQVLSRLFLLADILLFVYTCNCGINYYAQPFSAVSGLVIEKSSAAQLYQLCAWLIRQAKANETTESYRCNHSGWRAEGVAAMKALGKEYPSLNRYYPRPKEVTFARILSVQQLSGIYSPFTIEANFNGEMPDYNVPYTICHELSHLCGFMRQESQFQADVVSKTDDYGLMQINTCNHEYLTEILGVTDYLDPYENIRAGMFVLRKLFEKYETPEKVLMAYNMGETGASRLWEKNIFEINYSKSIMQIQQQFNEELERKGIQND